MLNYYHLLKISDLCNDAEVITMAYRRAIAEKAHGNESDDGFRERICGVTEAYLVLSDMLLKNRYDHVLSEGTPLDDDLSQHIAAKRSEAEAFVLARLGARGSRLPESYRSKRKRHKALIGIAIGVIVLLVTVFGQCHSPVDDLGRFQAPPSWEKVSVSNAEIQVPPGMELSREDGSLAGEGLILHVEYFAHGDVPAHDQSPRITEQDCKEAESAMRTYMPEIGVTNFSKPELRWVSVDPNNALELRSNVTLEDGSSRVLYVYTFPNDTQAAYLTIAAGEGMSYPLSTLKDIVRTFRWK